MSVFLLETMLPGLLAAGRGGRAKESELFVNQTLIEPVFSILYIFRFDLGMGTDAFMGDGGREVFELPKYIVLPAHSRTSVSIRDREGRLGQLPKGDYGAKLVTIMAPTQLSKGDVDLIDLGDALDNFKRERRSGRVSARSSVRRVSTPIAFFHKE